MAKAPKKQETPLQKAARENRERIARENAQQSLGQNHPSSTEAKPVITMTPEQLSALIKSEVASAVGSIPKPDPVVVEKVVEKIVHTPVKSHDAKESIDDIPGLEYITSEYKDRVYMILENSKSVSHGLRVRDKKGSPLVWTNPITKKPHALRYTRQHPSIFMDVQGNDKVVIEHVIFKDGVLHVPKENVTLQKFMAIHPDNGVVWAEKNAQAEAAKELENIELKFKAEEMVRTLPTLHMETVASLVCSDYTTQWSSTDARLGLYRSINERTAKKIIELCNNKSLPIIGIGRRAVQLGFITYENNRFTDMNGNPVLDVPMNAPPYEALAQHLSSPNGDRLYQYLKDQVS